MSQFCMTSNYIWKDGLFSRCETISLNESPRQRKKQWKKKFSSCWQKMVSLYSQLFRDMQEHMHHLVKAEINFGEICFCFLLIFPFVVNLEECLYWLLPKLFAQRSSLDCNDVWAIQTKFGELNRPNMNKISNLFAFFDVVTRKIYETNARFISTGN